MSLLLKVIFHILISFAILRCATYSNKTVNEQGGLTGEVHTYEIINQSDGWNEKIIAALKTYFVERGISAQPRSSKDTGHCRIEVTYRGKVGAGIEFLTGLSLGIIPTASFEYPSHEIQIYYSEGNAIKKQTKYELRFWTINWLPFALPAWVFPQDNDYRRKREIYHILNDFLKPAQS